jgi:prevent-host-death family protein
MVATTTIAAFCTTRLSVLKKLVYNIFRSGKEDRFMPNIKSSTDLRNNYNEISTFCRESREPVFITKNGQGDLAVMSMELYEMLTGKLELYRLLDEGRAAVAEGRKRSLEDVMRDIRQEITDGRI